MINWLILAISVVGLIYLGGRAGRRVSDKDESDFLVAGRSLGPFVLAGTIIATGFSGWGFIGSPGAAYQYDKPDDLKWKDVIELTQDGIKTLKPYLDGFDYPLLWTMDYILDFDENGNDIYVLSEINTSCVGITTELQYADEVAKAFVS
ncbi:MAG: hypothetical protein CSA19_00775 [Deltaproteobacteria bacterium]|nr:MAG: hypothetical protein CSA19_00775 [Deltaproteobacteria bacterium]